MVAVISKMSFLISGTIIGMVSLVCIARRGLLVKAIPIGLIGVGVIIAPPVIWKHIQFGGSILEALTNPFPGNWPGTQSFLEFLKRYRDTNIIFPLSLILPANLGTITTTLGCGLVIALWNLLRSKNNKQWVLIFCATLVTIITIFFGQLTSRFFLEPYLWLSIAASIGLIAINRKLIYAVSTLVLIQSVIMLLPLFYGVVTLFPGSISNMLRDKVMHKNANGYAVMEWANSALPKSSTLISDTWLALSPRNTISNEWMIFTPTIDSDRQIYAKRVILKKPNFKLITTTSPQNSLPPDCMRSVYAGPFEYSDAQRNPFNKGAKKYAWLIKITNDVYLCERKN
jgi:hypothetical protein